MKKIYLILVWFALHAGGLYAQNVGIGTAGPVAKLDINDGGYAVRERTAASANAITIPANTSTFRILPGGAATGTMALSATGVDGQRMVIVNDHATHAATFAGATVAAGGGTGNFVYIGGAWRYFGGFPTTSTAWNLTGNAGTNPTTNFLGTTDAQDLSIRAGTTGRVRVYADGRVLVGSSINMSSRLTVGGHNSTLRLTGAGTNESGATMYFGDGANVSLQEDSDNTLRIDATGRTAIMGGNVGIKTTGPIQDLDVNGRIHVNNGVIQRGGTAITTTSDLGLYSQVAGNWMRFVTNNAPMRFYSDNGIGTNHIVTFESNGNVGIGNVTPTQRLQVEGAIRFSGSLMPNNDAGVTGRRLESQGAGFPPIWFDAKNDIYVDYGTTSLVTNSSTFQVMPGLSRTINLPAGARVLIWGDAGALHTSSWATLDFAVCVNGDCFSNNGGFTRVSVDYTTATWVPFGRGSTYMIYTTPSAGNYTFTYQARKAGGGNTASTTFSGDVTSALNGTLMIQVVR